MADVRQPVILTLPTDSENYTSSPADHLPAVATLLDQVAARSTALAPLRQPATTTTAP